MDFECQSLYIVAKQFDDLLESLRPFQILRLFLVYYSLDVVLLFSNWYSTRKRTRPFSFHAHREGRRAGVDSAACTATAEKTAKTRF